MTSNHTETSASDKPAQPELRPEQIRRVRIIMIACIVLFLIAIAAGNIYFFAVVMPKAQQEAQRTMRNR
jgi:flagellar basal body-associated protein FliL